MRKLGKTAVVTVVALVLAGAQTAAHPATPTTALPTCMGHTVTIMGTPGGDHLVGQSGVSDVIYGGGGDDYISGGAFWGDDAVPGRAPDYICGGPGDDYIDGGPGNDHINGGDGNDHINGWQGADVMRGNNGDDKILDWSCADCDTANDVLIGGEGNDFLVGAWGNDRIEGNTGNDTLEDDECQPSVLLGGPGNDYIESWSSSFEGYGAYTCSDHDFFRGVTADRVDGGKGTDSSKDDVDDRITDVEQPQIVLHGQYD